MNNIFQVPAAIKGIRTLADNTIRLQIDCQELPPDQMTALFELRNKLGWFVFKENEVQPDDIPTEQAKEFKSDKSLSERLRNVLYCYWDQCTKKSEDFETWRRRQMERKIQEIKDQLPNNYDEEGE
jgi:hypothetical protein